MTRRKTVIIHTVEVTVCWPENFVISDTGGAIICDNEVMKNVSSDENLDNNERIYILTCLTLISEG